MNLQQFINNMLANPVPYLIPIFTVLGILALVYGFMLRVQGKSIKWGKTNGTLLDCRVTSRTATDSVSNVTINEAHIVTLHYRYTVNGKNYEGNKFKVGISNIGFVNRKDAESVAARFKASPNPVVYYNPLNPADCALSPGQRQTGMSAELNFGAGIVLLVLALGMFFIYRPY